MRWLGWQEALPLDESLSLFPPVSRTGAEAGAVWGRSAGSVGGVGGGELPKDADVASEGR